MLLLLPAVSLFELSLIVLVNEFIFLMGLQCILDRKVNILYSLVPPSHIPLEENKN